MKIGILGGGQLSRMLALAGIPLGVDFVFFDPKKTECVKNLGASVNAEFSDFAAVEAFAKQVDVITYESENIDIKTVEHAAKFKPLYPGVEPIRLMQDRLLEKNFFNSLGVPTTKYFQVDSKEDLLKLSSELEYPVFIKKRKSGYDGKGQIRIENADELISVDEQWCDDCIVEAFAPFDREVSIIGCRNLQGKTIFYDLCENVHEHGILRQTTNQLNDPMFEKAKAYLLKIMEKLDYVGICTLELFQVGDELLANEGAPRVHNSGHWTIEGAVASQFENHVRAMLDWPLGSTASIQPVMMFNLLSTMPETPALLAFEGLHLHDYVKAPAKGRKLGHVTLARDKADAYLKDFDALL